MNYVEKLRSMFEVCEQKIDAGYSIAFEELLIEIGVFYDELGETQRKCVANKIFSIMNLDLRFGCDYKISYAKRIMTSTAIEYENCIKLVSVFEELVLLRKFGICKTNIVDELNCFYKSWGERQTETTKNIINQLIKESNYLKNWEL